MSEPKSSPPNKSQYGDVLKYTGIASQLIAVLLVGYWLGAKVDKWLDMAQPIFAALLMLLFMGAFFYKLIKDLSSDRK